MEYSEGGPPDQSGDVNPGVDDQVTGEGDEGRRQAETTPPVGDQDMVPGQTSTPAGPDDVGVPPDDEMEREPGEG